MILIDMEMPKDCEVCPLNDDYAECALLNRSASSWGRFLDCPMKEMDYGELVLAIFEMGKATDAIQDLAKLLKEDEDEQLHIIHCKDCYYFSVVNDPYCENWCTTMSSTVDEDGYCYRARKKDD